MPHTSSRTSHALRRALSSANAAAHAVARAASASALPSTGGSRSSEGPDTYEYSRMAPAYPLPTAAADLPGGLYPDALDLSRGYAHCIALPNG